MNEPPTHGKQQGKDAFKFVFGCFLIILLLLYLGIRKLQEWISSWPLFAKIFVPSIFGIILILLILSNIFENKNGNKSKSEEINY